MQNSANVKFHIFLVHMTKVTARSKKQKKKKKLNQPYQLPYSSSVHYVSKTQRHWWDSRHKRKRGRSHHSNLGGQ